MEYDIEEMAFFLLQNQEEILAVSDEAQVEEMKKMLKGCLLVLPIQALQSLSKGNPQQAELLLHAWLDFSARFMGKISWVYHKYIVQVFLALGKAKQAEELCLEYIQKRQRGNETMWFHLGNAYAEQENWLGASQAYQQTLDIKPDFPEAVQNWEIVKGKKAITKEHLYPYAFSLQVKNAAYQDLPIFINSRDRVHCLQKLVGWLLFAGYRKIYILDNDSTYAPLLAYYRVLQENPYVRICFLRKNLGHTALWDSGLLNQLHIQTPYVYTDSDILPVEDCPKDIVAHLWRILRRYPFLEKAGIGLRYDDISCFHQTDIQERERAYYRFPLESEVYFSPIDTTFALYQNIRHYTVLTSARTTGRCQARHLPWYYDYGHLPEDEQYYMQHANASSSLSEEVKQCKAKKED